MHVDPSTLLQAIAVLCLVSAGAFAAGARICSLSPAAAFRWSLANLLFALGSMLTVWRAGRPEWALFATADMLELAGFAAVLSGFRVFVRQPERRSRSLLALGAAAALIAATYASGLPTLRLWIYCTVAAWLLGQAAWAAYRHLRDEFGLRAAWIVAAPMGVACALQLMRAVGGLATATEAANMLAPTPFNIAVMWLGFVVVLCLEFACAGFIGARQVARIHALTLNDPLTEALNRRALDAVLERELRNLSRHGQPLALVYFDLDHFKALNDGAGHAAGDAALRHVAALAQRQCRQGDAVARVGGEEFCVVLPFTNLEGGCLMAERLRHAFDAEPLHWAGRPIPLTASFGVASAEADETLGASDMLARGDAAMYAAKRAGRNCVATGGSEVPAEASRDALIPG